MLIIGREQYDALSGRAERDFCWRMCTFIDEHFGHLSVVPPREKREAWVRAAMAICERHGITTEQDAAQLILLLLVLGIESANEPWVREILDDADLAAEGKLRKLIRASRERGIRHVDEVALYDALEG